jgi:DNA-binding MarR family transcriptional regulator
MVQDLRYLISHLNREMRKVEDPSGLTSTDWDVMIVVLKMEEVSPVKISEVLKMSSQLVSHTLGKLEGFKYLERNASPKDKRMTLVSLTNVGKAVVQAARRGQEHWLETRIEEKCSDKDKQLIKEAVRILERMIKK